MERVLDFYKLSGSGNDFICIDNRDGRFDAVLDCPDEIGAMARRLCQRGVSVGADGVIFACPNEVEDFADIAARFFEADGSEVELCGNGTACFTHWVIYKNWVADGEIRILTSAGVVRGSNGTGKYVKVCIPFPEQIERGFVLEACGRRWDCDFAVTGVSHVVTYVPDVDAIDVEEVGAALRHHDRFRPRGANANFVQVVEEGKLAVRTFEFGVEGETLACGTGSATAAILAALRHNWSEDYRKGRRPVLVRARSGDTLKVRFELDDDLRVVDLCLESVVRFIYRGRVDLAALSQDAGAPRRAANLPAPRNA
jgi:diaminopimelate epimerase